MAHSIKQYSKYYNSILPAFKTPYLKTYLSPLITIALMAFLVIFIIKPTASSIPEMQKKLEESNNILSQLKQKSSNLKTAVNNYHQLDHKTQDQIQSAIPNVVEIKSVLQNLEQAALTNQASISAIQFQPFILDNKPQDPKNIKLSTLEFVYNVEGSYDSIISILASLRKSPRLFNITKVTITQSPQSNQNLLMSISAKAYFLP